jgi:hypothetical protein
MLSIRYRQVDVQTVTENLESFVTIDPKLDPIQRLGVGPC